MKASAGRTVADKGSESVCSISCVLRNWSNSSKFLLMIAP